MDAFETLIARLLDREGNWTRVGFKVELTKEEKRAIGRHSSPRWELDVIAFRTKPQRLLVVECKSYLDSRGVTFESFRPHADPKQDRFKLFNEPKTREVVFDRLRRQLAEKGLVSEDCPVSLGLAVGKFATEKDRVLVAEHFGEQAWALFEPTWVKDGLEHMAKGGYDNDPAVIAAKVLRQG